MMVRQAFGRRPGGGPHGSLGHATAAREVSRACGIARKTQLLLLGAALAAMDVRPGAAAAIAGKPVPTERGARPQVCMVADQEKKIAGRASRLMISGHLRLEYPSAVREQLSNQ